MTTGAERGLRLEIQALRALAVMAVVANHVWPHAVTGGFVGVDVFFVISGFLITGHLLEETDRSGTVALAAFWGRRIRRLLPAALLVLLVSLAASMAFLPESAWGPVIREVTASALYVQNWALAADSVDYFASQRAASPVTHFWSLSVEEQFYVVWPVAMVLVAMACRRRRQARRAALGALMLLIVVASLTFAVIYTASHPDEAYFVTPARAWEFGIGGLLAMAATPTADDARRRVPAAWLGWIAIAASVALYAEGTSIPGLPALVPVLGAALVIWAGHARTAFSPGAVVASMPVQFTGGISYSLYLWHWPVFVLAPYVTGREFRPAAGVFVVLISLGLAWLTRTVVEVPVRSWRVLRAERPRRSLVFAALATAGVLAVTTGCTSLLEQRAEAMRAELQAVAQELGSCSGAGVFGAPANACASVPSTPVVPAPAIAVDDTGSAFDCYDEPGATSFTTCTVVRPERPERRVALVGDSHGAVLSVALKEIARVRNWQLDVYLRSACPLSTADVFYDPQFSPTCSDFRMKALAELEVPDRYDMVVVTGWSGLSVDRRGLPTEERVSRLATGYRLAWQQVAAGGAQVVVVPDNPVVPGEMQDCVVDSPAPAADCVVPRDQALPEDPLRDAAADLGLPVVDLTDYYCDDSGCPMVVGGVLVHFDTNHVTATYMKTLTPYLDAGLVRVSQ